MSDESNGSDQSPHALPGIPDHELIRCIGSGSYGKVYLARSTMGIYRAIKVVRLRDFKDTRPFERELTGIRRFVPVSRSHEGFVDILHVGHSLNSDYFYYIMELGDDFKGDDPVVPDTYVPKTLDRVVKATGQLPLDQCFQIGLSLANALSQLHKQGLVHRDIKPSNILFVGGIPKLADVGLVAHVADPVSIVGTEGFIPPEGTGHPPADIFSLGKVLFEISTGKDRNEFPSLPTRVDELPEIDKFRELNQIVLKACAPAVSNRYATADSMHADLAIAASGGSVTNLRLAERRLAQFKKVAVAGSTGLIVFCVIAFEAYRTVSLGAEARQREVGSKVAQGISELDRGQLLNAIPAFVDALAADTSARSPVHRARINATLEQTPKVVQMWIEPAPLVTARFGPTGTRVVIAQEHGKARVYDAHSGKPLGPYFGPSANLVWASFDPTENFVVTAAQRLSGHDSICIWAVQSGDLIARLPYNGYVNTAVFSPDGERLLTSCKDGTLQIWDWKKQVLEKTLSGHTNSALSAMWNSDGTLIVSTGKDNCGRIWDSRSGQQIGQPLPHANWVYYAAFNADSTKVVTAGHDNQACVWEVHRDGKQPHRKLLPALKHHGGVTSAEFSADGLSILTACFDGSASLWDAHNLVPIPLNAVLGHGTWLCHASFAPDCHRFVTAAMDGTARVWDLAGSVVVPVKLSGRMNRDATRYVAVTDDILEIRELPSSLLLGRIPAKGTGVTNLLDPTGVSLVVAKAAPEPLNAMDIEVSTLGNPIEPSSKFRASCSSTQIALCDGGGLLATVAGANVLIWDVTLGLRTFPALEHPAPVTGVEFSRDGLWLAVSYGPCVQVWNLRTGSKAFPPIVHKLPATVAMFSPDTHFLITACGDQNLTRASAQICRIPGGNPAALSLMHGDSVTAAAFSPDSKMVATSSEDHTAAVWEVKSGRLLGHKMIHADEVLAVAFSPDGRFLATECRDRSARVWDVESCEVVTPRLAHTETFYSIQFSRDKEHLICATKNGRIEIWNFLSDQRNVAELQSLLPILGSHIDGLQDGNPRSGLQSRFVAWQANRRRQPEDFIPSKSEALAWHEQQARFASNEGFWDGAVFHFREIMANVPENQTLKTRLHEAMEHSKIEKAH